MRNHEMIHRSKATITAAPSKAAISVAEASAVIERELDRLFEYKPNPSLAEILASTFGQMESWLPQIGIRVTTGAGKTEAVLRWLQKWIGKCRAEGWTSRVLFLVPTHKLGAEMLSRASRVGLNAAVYRGREAELPGSPSMKMCADTEAIRLGVKIGADLRKDICGELGTDVDPKSKSHKCCFRFQCPWWGQLDDCRNADMLIATHEFLWFELPGGIGDGIGLTIIDENFWQRGLEIPNDNDSRRIPIEGFARAVELAPGSLTPDQARALSAISAKVETALRLAWGRKPAAAESVPLARAEFLEAGLMAQDVEAALCLERQRMVKPELRPGMTAEARRAAVKPALINEAIRLREDLWRTIQVLYVTREKATGWLVLEQQGERLNLTVLGRKPVREAILGKPIVHLDATMAIAAVRSYFPQLRLIVDVDVEAPYQRVVQVLGRSASGSRGHGNWSRLSLDPRRTRDKAERNRREKRLKKVQMFCLSQNAGIVTHEGLLPNFEMLDLRANFNATLGLDKFRDVPALVVLGRPLPSPDALLSLARALTGKPILPADPVWLEGKLRYPEPSLDLVHEATTQAELLQAIGRPRGVQRKSEAESVVIWVFVSDHEVPADEAVRWEEIEPSLWTEMEAEGLILNSPTDLKKIYPHLAVDDEGHQLGKEALKKRLQRGRPREPISGTSPYIYSNRGTSPKSSPWVEVRYRPKGRGQQTRTAWVAPDRMATLQADLERALGRPVVLE
jgi:putative DNA primase/helicase